MPTLLRPDLLPSAIALPLAAFRREDVPTLALWAACDLVEMTLRLCVMAGVAQHPSPLPVEVRRALRGKVERPTLGAWRDMAHDLAKNESREVAFSIVAPVEATRRLLGAGDDPNASLLALRNRLAHGGMLAHKNARALCSIWVPRVEAWVEGAIAPFQATRLVAIDADGRARTLLGEVAVPVEPGLPVPSDARPGSAWLCAGGRALALGPLASFDAGVRMYVRRGEVRLQYVRVSEEGGFADSDPEDVAIFERLFLADERAQGQAGYRIVGFDDPIRGDAARRVGRTDELDRLLQAARGGPGRVVWVPGKPGIGKSILFAALAARLLDEAPERTRVLPYRFKVNDPRCGRGPFLQYVAERVDGSLLATKSRRGKHDEESGTATDPKELAKRLARLRGDVTLILVLDGLDEIVRQDTTFVTDVLSGLCQPRVTIVATGRPELDADFARMNAYRPFEDHKNGLPPMRDDDVRYMLLENAVVQRRRILAHDDGARNAFIDAVCAQSKGFPFYVMHVIGDLNDGRLDAARPETLPAGLDAYHDAILARARSGDVQGIVTAVLATLASAYEGLTPAELAALLVRRELLADADEPLVERALHGIASLIRRVRRPDGADAYTLFHHTLHTRVTNAPDMHHAITTARRTLATAAERPEGDAATRYLRRCGVRHLLAQDPPRAQRAVELLQDLPTTLERFQEPGDAVTAWADDWRRVHTSGRGLGGDALDGVAFALEHARALRASGDRAHRALFQLAIEQADTSPLTRQAEAYASSGRCTWPWLRLLNRPARASPAPLTRIFEGHQDEVKGAILRADGSILSWSDDGTVRSWGPLEGACQVMPHWHARPLAGLRETDDGMLVSWADDGTVRVGTLTHTEIALTLDVPPQDIVPVGRTHLLVRTRMGKLLLRELRTGAEVPIGDTDTRGVLDLGDGSVLCWGRRALCRWWPSGERPAVIWSDTVDYTVACRTPGCVTLLREGGDVETYRVEDGACVHRAALGPEARGLTALADGRIVAWFKDDRLCAWTPGDGPAVTMACRTNNPSGAAGVDAVRLVSWESSRTLRVWRSDTGEELGRWRCPGRVKGSISLPDGTVLSWGLHGLLFAWDPARVEPLGVDGHHENAIQDVRVLASGRVVTCASDRSVRVWSAHGVLERVYVGHTRSVAGLSELSDGRVLSWERPSKGARSDNACELRAWCPVSGERDVVFERAPDGRGHVGAVRGAVELADGRLLSWGADGSLCTWDLEDGRLQQVVRLGVPKLLCAVRLSDGTIVTAEDKGALVAWSPDGAPICAAPVAAREWSGMVDAQDGSVLAWSEEEVVQWDPRDGRVIRTLDADPERRWRGVASLDPSRFVVWHEARHPHRLGASRPDRAADVRDAASGEVVAAYTRDEGVPRAEREGALVPLHAWLLAPADTLLIGLPWRGEHAYLTSGRILRAYRIIDATPPG